MLIDDLRQDAEREMPQLAARVPGAETAIHEGSPRQVILAVAADSHADMIVMGTHGRTGPAHLLFGSVAEHVVRRAQVPVFTIRGRAA